MLDGEIIEELRRCSVCEVRRPVWAFTRKVQTERNGARGEYLHNCCRGCSSGSSPPQKAKRAGKPIGEVQRLANVSIDRIRAKEALGAWDPSTHRPEEAARLSEKVVQPNRPHQPEPIIKFCKCCQEQRVFSFSNWSSERNRWRHGVTCDGCQSACMKLNNESKKHGFAHLSVSSRRERRDQSVAWISTFKDRESRGVRWCGVGKHEAPVSHFAIVSRKNGANGKRISGTCRSCNSSVNQSAPLTGSALLDHNELLLGRFLKKNVSVDGAVSVSARPAPSLDEYVTSRQESFERAEAAPKPSRQVRRATERRIAKDARSITKRIMTDVEVAREAISKGIAARSRANGGERTVKKTKSKVKWNLSPEVAAEILKRQGYRCALTGRPFQASTGFGSSNPYAPSPNRIDAGKDYTPENCEFVLWSINRLISDAPRLAALDLLADLGLLNEKGPTR